MLSSSYFSYNDLRGQAGLHRLMCSLKELIDSLVPLGPFLGNMVSQTSSQPSRAYHNITSAHLHTSSSSVYVCVSMCFMLLRRKYTTVPIFFDSFRAGKNGSRFRSTFFYTRTHTHQTRFYTLLRTQLRKKGHEIFGARNRIERAFVVCCAYP